MKKSRLLLLTCLSLIITSISYAKISYRSPEGNVNQFDISKNTTPKTDASLVKTILETKYNEELYQLSYDTFLGTGDVEDSFWLAMSAVRQRPNDLVWREKLAKTALWTGRSGEALKEYIYIAYHTKKESDIETALQLSKKWLYLNSEIELLNFQLKEKPNDPATLFELAKAQEAIGESQAALITLRKLEQFQMSRKILEEKALIYKNIGNMPAALATWRKIEARYGVNSKDALNIAQIYSQTGNISQALNALNKASYDTTSLDPEYWKALGNLSWLLNRPDLAIKGYKQLEASGKGDTSTIERLVLLLQSSQPSLAYHYALKGWRTYRERDLFLLSTGLGVQLRDWPTVAKLYLSVPTLKSKLQLSLKKLPNYWIDQAVMLRGLGEVDSARLTLQRGIVLYPNLNEIKSEYLWFQIGQGNKTQTRIAMVAWQPTLLMPATSELMWLAYAHGLVLLNKPHLAIKFYQQRWNSGKYWNDEWYSFYADALEKAGFYDKAYKTRLVEWDKVNAELKKNSPETKIDSLRNISQLARYISSGDAEYPLMASLIVLNRSATDGDNLLTWSVHHQEIDLIKYLKTNYYYGTLPNWAELNLAITSNDKQSMRNLLKQAGNLPNEDRVTAAERIEDYPKAQQLIYQGLSEQPNNIILYNQFVDTMLAAANDASIDEHYEQFGQIRGPATVLTAKYFLTPRYCVIPFATTWVTKSASHKQIINVPSNDYEGGVTLQEYIHRGVLGFTVSDRNALNNSPATALRAEYQISSRSQGDFILGFNQRSYLNTYMEVGGTQDMLRGRVSYKFTQKDSLDTGIEGDNFYSQNRHYLGDGLSWSEELSHKLWISYPDYTVGIFSDVNVFGRNGTYGGVITSLFPNTINLPAAVGEEPITDPLLLRDQKQSNYANIIPNSFSEAGVHFHFGDNLKSDYKDESWRPHASVYTHNWRPYGSVRIYYNTLVGISNNVEGGVTGSVFGRDNLAFYAERGSASSQANQVDYYFGARYRLYF